MRGKITLIDCPKLDGVDYAEKLTQIIASNDITSLTVVRMEVPCCAGIEIFSIDTHVVCERGFVAYNDTQSCIKWCAHARECVGEEIHKRFMEREKEERGREDGTERRPVTYPLLGFLGVQERKWDAGE